MNDTEKTLRQKLNEEFENCVKEAKEQSTGQAIFDDLIIKAYVGNLYQSLKEQHSFALMYEMLGVNYDEILEEECNKVLNKHNDSIGWCIMWIVIVNCCCNNW